MSPLSDFMALMADKSTDQRVHGGQRVMETRARHADIAAPFIEGGDCWNEIAMAFHVPCFLVNPVLASGDGESIREARIVGQVEQLEALVRATGQGLSSIDAQLLSPAWLNKGNGWRLERIKRVARGAHPFKRNAPTAYRLDVESGASYVLADDVARTQRYTWTPIL